MNKESAEALQKAILELCSMIVETLEPVLAAANAMAKYLPEEPDGEKKEYPAPLTLEQIKKMDGCTVVIPYSISYFGGVGVVDLNNDKIADPLNPRCLYGWPLSDYGNSYVAFPICEAPDDK